MVGKRKINDAVLDSKFLEMLVCPLTHKGLRYDREKGELICDAAKLAYPIHDGIPVMLPSQARLLDDSD